MRAVTIKRETYVYLLKDYIFQGDGAN